MAGEFRQNDKNKTAEATGTPRLGNDVAERIACHVATGATRDGDLLSYRIVLTRKDGTIRDDFDLVRGRAPQHGDQLDLPMDGALVRARVTMLTKFQLNTSGTTVETVERVVAVEV